MLEGGMTMTAPKPELFAPPWRDRQPNGELGAEYGPKTATTYARHVAAYRDWAYRTPSKEARRPDADQLIAWMRGENGSLRDDVPRSEQRAYELVYEQGHSTRFAARKLAVARASVVSALRRLRARAGLTNGG